MIHLIYTGGTLGMVKGADGALIPADIDALLKHVPLLSQVALCDYFTLDPPRDSVDLGPSDWLRLGQHIAEVYDRYEGFVVLHGTDTMVYTAAALSFLLEGLQKPVILTGAQAPIGQVRNDARNNLIPAVLFNAAWMSPAPVLPTRAYSCGIRGKNQLESDRNSPGKGRREK